MKKFKDCKEVILGKNVRLADDLEMSGGKIILDDGVQIRKKCVIHIVGQLKIGKNSIISENCVIRGRDISLGREFYANHHSEIGGGSCFEKHSRLEIGYWFHMGSYSIVNTTMPIKIGNQVGIGRFTNIYTHGAYLSCLDGFPVTFGPVEIGNNVWIPSATVLPNVKIGSNVVIGVGSIITKDIPSNCLAVGAPCKVVKENYPVQFNADEKAKIIEQIFGTWDIKFHRKNKLVYEIDKAQFDFSAMKIMGTATNKAERTRDIMRRHGIRFMVEVVDEHYVMWGKS